MAEQYYKVITTEHNDNIVGFIEDYDALHTTRKKITHNRPTSFLLKNCYELYRRTQTIKNDKGVQKFSSNKKNNLTINPNTHIHTFPFLFLK